MCHLVQKSYLWGLVKGPIQIRLVEVLACREWNGDELEVIYHILLCSRDQAD